MDNEMIVRRAIGGDEDAFYELLTQQKDRLYRIALAYLKTEEDALEVIQETTYRAWKTKRKLRDPRFFSTWLVRILLNCCHDEWKRKKRVREHAVHEVMTTPAASGESTWVGRLDILEALDQLNPKYKQVIILKYYEDMTLSEMAEAMNKPVGTVKTWLHKALKQLRPLMTEAEEEMRHGAGYERTH